jgi:hypothetical protein
LPQTLLLLPIVSNTAGFIGASHYAWFIEMGREVSLTFYLSWPQIMMI